MNGRELLRALRKVAKSKGVQLHYEARHGKGSHGQLAFGDRVTTMKDLKKEIGPGLLHDMLAHLGLTKEDLG